MTQYLVLAALGLAAYYAFGDRVRDLLGRSRITAAAPLKPQDFAERKVAPAPEPASPSDPPPDPVQLLRAGIKGHKEKRQREQEDAELTGLLDELTRFAMGGPKKESPGPNG